MKPLILISLLFTGLPAPPPSPTPFSTMLYRRSVGP